MEAKDYVGCIFRGVGDGFWRIQELLGEDTSSYLPNSIKWYNFKFFYCTEDGVPLESEMRYLYKEDPYRNWGTTLNTLSQFLYSKEGRWELPPPPTRENKITRKIKQMAARQKWQPT